MNNELFLKWEKTKLLESAKTKESKIKLAQLLENQKVFNSSFQMPEEVSVSKELLNRISIPLVSRIFSDFILSDLIRFESLKSPTDNFKYRDLQKNINKNTELIAKTRFWKTQWNQSKLEQLYKETPLGLDAETEFFGDLYNDLKLELEQEILKDVSKVAPYNVNLYWSNVNLLVNTILIASSAIEKKINRSANWIVVPCEIYEELKKSSDFDLTLEFDSNNNFLQKVGKISKKWNVYVDPNVEDLEIILGHKGDEFDSGYLFCPYIVLGGLSKIEGEDSVYPMFLRYCKTIMNRDYYAKIIISGYSFKK